MKQIRNKFKNWIQNQNSMHISIAKEIGLIILDELFPTIVGIDWFGELWQYREIIVANTIGQNALNLTMLSNVLFIHLMQIIKRKSQRVYIVTIQEIDIIKNVSFFKLNQWIDQSVFKIEIMFTQLLKCGEHNFAPTKVVHFPKVRIFGKWITFIKFSSRHYL